MWNYLLRRLIITIPVVLGVCTITFLLIHFVPGDPIDVMLGDQAAAVDKEALRAQLGLNLPLGEQYKNFLVNAAKFDLGRSLYGGASVTGHILERFPATLELSVVAIFFALLFGIPLGVIAAIKQYSWIDNSVLVSGLVGISLPGFFLGPLLIYIFAIQLPWFPVSERGGFDSIVLPAISLALPLGAIILRMTRASMLEVIQEDYIRTARAKGNTPFLVYFKHALRNALMPIVTIVGLQVGALLTGTVITETVFDWPGIGTLLFQSITRRDYPQVQGCVLFIALVYVFVNLATDLAYALVNPKVRLS